MKQLTKGLILCLLIILASSQTAYASSLLDKVKTSQEEFQIEMEQFNSEENEKEVSTSEADAGTEIPVPTYTLEESSSLISKRSHATGMSVGMLIIPFVITSGIAFILIGTFSESVKQFVGIGMKTIASAIIGLLIVIFAPLIVDTITNFI